MSDHVWDLRGGGRIEISSELPTDVAMFQCEECGLCATQRLTNRQQRESAVIPKPNVEKPCNP